MRPSNAADKAEVQMNERRSQCKSRRSQLPWFFCAALMLTTACKEDVVVVERPLKPETVVAALTGTALASLNSDGHFAGLTTSAPDEINAGEAARFANAYAHQFAPLHFTYLQNTRGAAVDLKQLHACGRPLYAASAFDPLPSDIDVAYRRPYGAWWMVTLCAGDEPQVSLAVSAMATDMRIVDGNIRFPAFHGNEFFAIGIPAGHYGEFPMSPEVAAVRAAQLTGRRVQSVPELIIPGPTAGLPQEAKWQLVIEAPTQLHGEKTGDLETDKIYTAVVFGRDGLKTTSDFLATPDQPAGIEFQFPPVPRIGESHSSYDARFESDTRTAFARRNPSRPIKFDIAERGIAK